MNKSRYYELKEYRSGIPFHNSHRFLGRFIKGTLHYWFRNSIIHNIMRNAFPGRRENNFRDIFEISFNLLDGLSDEGNEILMLFVQAMSGEHIHFQLNLGVNRDKISKLDQLKTSNREKFMILMNYYVELYEGYYRCISSMYVLAKLVHNRSPMPSDPKAFANENVTEKIQILLDDTGNVVPSLPELCQGCERHLRNAINHNRWKMLGRKAISAWDVHGRKITWKQEYTLDSLKEVLVTLMRTVDAMDLAFMVFVNNLFKKSKGLYVIPPGEDYEDEFVRDVIENVSADLGLFTESCDYDNQTDSLMIHLYVPVNLDTAQESTIYEGTNPSRAFKQIIEVMDEKLNNAVLNLLLITSGMLQSYSKIALMISDEEKGEIGRFDIASAELDEFYKGKHRHMEEVFAPLESHVLKVTVAGLPIPTNCDKEEVLKVIRDVDQAVKREMKGRSG